MKGVALLAMTAFAIAGLAYAWQTVGAVSSGLPLRLVGDYPLTGKTTRFDYANMDAARAARGNVYAAAQGLSSIVVLNGHAVAVDPRSHRVYLPLQNVGGRPVMRVMEPQ